MKRPIYCIYIMYKHPAHMHSSPRWGLLNGRRCHMIRDSKGRF
jgi:hypothetical protein